jgi:hypothetical protein
MGVSLFRRTSVMLLLVVTTTAVLWTGEASGAPPQFTVEVLPYAGVPVTCNAISPPFMDVTMKNARGDVAGRARNGCEQDVTAWVWSGGKLYDLLTQRPAPYPDGTWGIGFDAEALDMNDSGQIVGWASSAFVQGRRPVLWDPANGYRITDLAAVDPSAGGDCYFRAFPPRCFDSGKATAINAHGDIALTESWYDFSVSGFVTRNFIYRHGTKEDVATAPPFVPSGRDGAANTNRWGQTVIGDTLVSGGAQLSLAALAPGLPSGFVALAITDRGQIVGQATARGQLVMLTPQDTSPPLIGFDVQGLRGSSGVYTGDVTVSWALSDPESNIAWSSGCETQTIGRDVRQITLTCSAVNGATLMSTKSVTLLRGREPTMVQTAPQH